MNIRAQAPGAPNLGAPRLAAARLGALDAARGLAVLAMVAFHLIWDLGHFGYIAPSIPWSTPVKAFGHSIAFSFLAIAGVSLVLAHRGGFHARAFWRRLLIVAGAAGLVSLGTYIVFPGSFVFFGILHCIAAASLLSVPFLFLPWPAALAASAFFVAGPRFLTSPVFDSDWLIWLGLSTIEPLTQDWRPLFPWAGAMLLGVGAAQLVLWRRGGAPEQIMEEASPPAQGDAPLSWLVPSKTVSVRKTKVTPLGFLGRHSLLIYLAHQPLLFAIFTGLVMLAPPPEDTGAFIAACEKGCIEEGAEKGFCHDACVCTQQEAERSKALAGVTDEEQRGKILKEIAGRCVADK